LHGAPGRAQQGIVDRRPRLRRRAPPRDPGTYGLPATRSGVENPAFRRQPGQHGIIEMMPHFIPGDLLISVAGGLVAGQVRFPVAVHQIGEGDAVGWAGGANDGSQPDGDRRIAIAERGHPLRCRHRLTGAGGGRTGRGAVESGAAAASLASSWIPSTWPRTSTRSAPPFPAWLMVM